MKQRLFGNALVTSPIIAIYGVSPFYIFDKMLLDDFLQTVVGLTCITFFFWVANIGLITKTRFQDLTRYFLSFVCVFGIQAFFMFVGRNNPVVKTNYEVAEHFLIYPMITTVAINIIILIICNSTLSSQKQKDAELEVEQLKVEKLEAQKQALMQQLHPHFLFNALSVLKSLIKENTDDAEEYTVKLSDFLRYSVESHKSDVVTLRAEIQFTKDYIELQKVRFGDSFVCDFDIPNAILGYKIPVLALQTLVENAFKHNHFTEESPLNIWIKLEKDKLVIWNNKVSLRMTERSGTGLNNLNRRYELITGKPIDIKDNEAAFVVKIGLINE
jgi:two-component system, LytTR family, sensor kinase